MARHNRKAQRIRELTFNFRTLPETATPLRPRARQPRALCVVPLVWASCGIMGERMSGCGAWDPIFGGAIEPCYIALGYGEDFQCQHQ
jgi:hypothetical protein